MVGEILHTLFAYDHVTLETFISRRVGLISNYALVLITFLFVINKLLSKETVRNNKLRPTEELTS